MCRFAGPPKTIGMEKIENNSTPRKSLGSVLWCFTLLPFPESLVCRLCELPLCLNWTENTQSFEIYKWDRNLKPSIIGKNGIWISFIPYQITKNKKILNRFLQSQPSRRGRNRLHSEGILLQLSLLQMRKGTRPLRIRKTRSWWVLVS